MILEYCRDGVSTSSPMRLKRGGLSVALRCSPLCDQSSLLCPLFRFFPKPVPLLIYLVEHGHGLSELGTVCMGRSEQSPDNTSRCEPVTLDNLLRGLG